MIQKYTLGFLFNHDLSRVLLIHKLRPAWQKGMVNGLGGKFEKDETAKTCITREVEEETNLKTNPSDWQKIGELHSSKFAVDVMVAIYSGQASDAVSNEEEKVEWFPTSNLPKNIMTNLSWLIPLALEKIEEKEIQSVVATYDF
jgi:8-oxo-dGTP diphosphatase